MAASPGVILEPVADIKFGQVGIANLRLKRLDRGRAASASSPTRCRHAPNLFARAPVVLDLEPSARRCPISKRVRDLLARIREAGMLPVGLSYGTTENEQLARALDVPLFAKFRAAFERGGRSEPVAEPPRARERRREPAAEPHRRPRRSRRRGRSIGLVHDKPVRSGQQVYARGRDLIADRARRERRRGHRRRQHPRLRRAARPRDRRRAGRRDGAHLLPRVPRRARLDRRPVPRLRRHAATELARPARAGLARRRQAGGRSWRSMERR